MDRTSALILTIIIFIILLLLTYYGAKIKLLSSIVFSIFISIIILNLFYPPIKIAEDICDFTLYLYALFQLVAIIFLFFYIAYTSLNDVRLC